MADLPEPPVIPTGQEIYDSIMSRIEPDLVSTVIDTIDEKYAGESEEEKKARKERYRKAFERYDEEYAKYMADLEGKVMAYKRDAMQRIEERSKRMEEEKLAALESELSAT